MAAMVRMGPEPKDPANDLRNLLIDDAANALIANVVRVLLITSETNDKRIALKQATIDVAAQIRRLKR